MRTVFVALALLASTAARAETYEEPAPAPSGPTTVAIESEPAPGATPSPPIANPLPSGSEPVVEPASMAEVAVTAVPQLQADVGLTVIMLGYEHPVGTKVSMQAEVGIMGTYFLPWFDLGDDVKGFGGGVRATWFATPARRGLYIAPYVRVARISGEREEAAATIEGTGTLVTAGAFAGYAFGLTNKLDLRLGLGAQYIYIDAGPLGASTPFVAIDAVVGYRL